jgi:uncharacterized protein
MFVKDQILKRPDVFVSLCAKSGVRVLFAFGSAISDSFDYEDSDVDLLVDIDEPDPVNRGEKIMSLWDDVEAFFGRKVDLLTNDSVRNPYLKNHIDSTKVLIYDRAQQKIFI